MIDVKLRLVIVKWTTGCTGWVTEETNVKSNFEH